MRVTEKMKKLLSILLCLCMLLQNAPVMAFAATTDNLCEHHTEHTAECGYREGSAGSACTHEHSEDCYKIVACKHTHDDTCSSGCSHTCTVENGCITMELDCRHVHGDCGYSEGTAEVPCGHVHNESCGYVEAVAGNPCANAETDPECDHLGSCGYVAAVEGQPCGHTACDDSCGYAPATEGTPCTHVCEVKVDSDDSCYKLLCSHKDGGHDDACGYVAAVEAHECHYECAECANSDVIANQSADWCGNPLCSQEDAFHVTSCAQYVAPENPVCYCTEKCTEVNEWCDVCGFDYAKCTGTDTAVTWDVVDLSSNTASFGNNRGTWYLNPDNAATEFYNLIDDKLMLGAYGYVPDRTYITTNAYDYRDNLGNDGFLWTDCKNQTIRDGRYYIYVFSRSASQINRIEYIVDVQLRYTVNISVTGAPSGYGGVTLNGSNAGSPQYLQKGGSMTLTVKDVPSHKHTVTFDNGVSCTQNGDTYAFSNVNKSFTFKVVYEADEFATVSFGQPEGATISVNGNSTSPVRVIAGMPYTVSVKTNDGYYLTGITVDGATTSLDTTSYNRNLTAGANGAGHTISVTTAKMAIPVHTTASITYTKNQDKASLVKAMKDAVYAGSDSTVKNSLTVNYLYFGDFYNPIADYTDIWEDVLTAGEMLSCNVKESVSIKLSAGDVYSQACTLYLYDGDISANGEIKKDYTEEPVKLDGNDFNCAYPANFSSSYPTEYRYYTQSGQRLSSAPTEVGKYQVQVKASSYHTNPGAFVGTSWTSWSGLIPFEIVSVPAYSITVENSSGGRVTASKETSIAGKTVTLTIEPDVGYLVDTVAYNGTAITPVEGVYSFTMPAGAVTISATFRACTHETYENGICTLCGVQHADHTGSEPTCTQKAVCDICGLEYGELADHSTGAEGDRAASCSGKAYCSACKSEYGELAPDNHASEEFHYIANDNIKTHKKVHECCNVTAVEAEAHTGEATYTPNADDQYAHDVTWSCCSGVVTVNCGSPTYTASPDGATGTMACGDCKRIHNTATIVAPACKVYGDGKSCEATLLLNGKPVEEEHKLFTYYQQLNGQWIKLDTTPTDAGTYRVELLLHDDTYYDHLDVILYVEYTIAKVACPEHTPDADGYTDNGDGTHSFACSVCNTAVTEGHTGGTATCTEQAECQHCGASYGDLDPDNHTYESNICCGYCGDPYVNGGKDVMWTLTDGKLTITGSGPMAGYGDGTINPWSDVRDGITSVAIGQGVTTIGYAAFEMFEALTAVELPEGMTTIGDGAFSYCGKLAEISIPDTVTVIGEYAFNATALTAVEIPAGVTTIGAGAFYHCRKLAEISIPNTVTAMGDYVFNQCKALTGITIPGSVKRIGELTFWDCAALETVTLDNGVETIGGSAFRGCTALKEITIPASVTSIGTNAFSGCDTLETANVSCGWAAKPLYTFADTVTVNIDEHTYENGKCSVCGAYDLWVAGEQISESKLTVNGTTGTATYDPATDTLTLNGFDNGDKCYGFTSNEYPCFAAIFTMSDLNIVLVGENSLYVNIDSEGYKTAIQSSGGLTIGGEGSLDAGTENWCISAVNGMTITGGTLDIYGTTALDGSATITGGNVSLNATDCVCYGTLTVNGGEVTLSAGSNYIESFGYPVVIGEGMAAYDENGALIENPDFERLSYALIKEAHVHSWTYTAEGDTIIATCNAEGCPDAEQSITISAVGKTYDGTPVTATLDGSIDGVTVSANDITYSGNTNAGTHTASITIEGKTASVKFTIEKATVTVTADAKSKTYGTDNPELTYRASGLVGNDTLTGALETTATRTSSVGEYDITVGSLGSSNYTIDFVGAKLTITKAAAPEIQWPTAAALTYGQKLSDSTLTSQDENGTFAWQDGSIVPTVKNNGYVVVYTPKDTDNYDYTVVELTETIPVTVSKAQATVIAAPTPKNLTYNGEGQYLISAGEANGGTMQYSTDNQTWSTTISQGTDAGKYTVYYKVVGDENHSDTAVDSIEVTIAKAQAVITVDTTTITVTYGETVSLPTATTNFGNVVCDKTADDLVNAGTYTVTYTVADTENFEGATKTLTVKVEQLAVAEPTVTGTYTYTGSELTAQLTGVESYMTVVSGNKGTNAGNYEVVITLDGNHKWTDGSDGRLQWTIAKAKAEISVNTDPITITYGETVTLPTATTNFGDVVCNKKASDIVNAGTYTVTYTVAGTDNYDGDTKAITVIVNAKAITVTADALSKTYGDADPKLTYKVEGLVNGDELTGELKRVAGENVGSYTIEQNTLTAGDNYTITYTGANLTINAKAITEADVELNGSLTYTGKELTQPITVTEGITYTVIGDKATNVGTYVLTVQGTGNYTGEVKLNWSIKETAAVVTKAPAAKTLTYTGEAQELITAGEAEGGTMQYQLNGGAWSASIPTAKDEGTYTVSWKVVGDANHADTEVKSITVTIGDCTHSGNTNKDDADCTTQVTCSVCGDVLVESKAHVWGDWTTTLEPTTTTEGSKERLCTNDGCEAKDTDSIPMLNEVEVPEEIVGGDVSVDNPTPATGDDVTITVTPDTGKEVDEVIVTGKDGKEIPVTDNGDGTYTYEQPDGDVTVEVIIKDTIYTVTWIVDGTTYKTTQYKYGETITAPTDPTKAQSGCTTYTFDKWNGFTAGMTMPDNESLTFTAVFTEGESHIDDNTDHSCDRNCGKTDMGDHVDRNLDHVCDYGCDVAIGEHKDANKDHACDYGCTESIGTCEDADKDHDCDYGCDKVYGKHEDNNADHICDYGCKVTIGTHEDTNKDHICDYGCSEAIGICEDADKDHDCDYGCDKVYGTHEDTNKDHVCDYGCTETIGTCEDADKDHDCDYGCDKVYGEHADSNKDHICDYGCKVAIGTCEDADKDHDCDYGCDKVYGEHADSNKDHICDYGCSESIGNCEDADKDHDCDYGCDKVYGTHEDTDKNHACDYGCSETIGTCEDADKDHDCDYGCDKVYGEHKDTVGDGDHVCDYGCGETLTGCADVDTDADHKCDECGAAMPKDGTQVEIPADDTGTITPGAPAEIDGKPIVIDWDGEIWLEDKDSKFLVTYKFNEDADPHKEYPTAMYAWLLKWDGESCKAIRVPELDNFMTYKGTSIRINHSSDGIRFFTAVPVDTLNQAMKGTLLTGELEGYKLVEMGTLYKWAATGTELTVANGAKSYVYGGSAGTTYRQFSKEGSLSWFTGMLTDLPGDAATLAKDILSRPYAIFENADGDQITLYGGSVQRSIYYVALQNKDTWASGTAYDNYVEKIIATVEAAND